VVSFHEPFERGERSDASSLFVPLLVLVELVIGIDATE
jgi:hypothetical protein